MNNKAIIIHGGCSGANLEDPREKSHQVEQALGLSNAINLAWSMLEQGSSAVDVAVAAVTVMEDCPAFNAGIGAAIGANRHVSLDASVMDGEKLQFGAVAALRGIPHAAQVANELRKSSKYSFRVGDGAQLFALEHGFKTIPEDSFITPYQLHWYEVVSNENENSGAKGTVGAVVLDAKGCIASCTSTGGITGKPFGRVGDSPLIGAGCYADNRFGGASATGYGEQIIKVNLCKLSIDFIRFQGQSAPEAAQQAIAELGQLDQGLGGLIMIDREGRIGYAANEPFLPRAYMSEKMAKAIVEF